MASIKSLPVQGNAVFEFASESEARGMFACEARSVFAILQRWHCDRAIVRIPGQPDLTIPLETIRLMSEFEPIVQIFFADTSLPATVLQTATRKLGENAGRWGIVRLSDERQVLMSSGMAGVLLSGVGIEETTRWRRPEFWLPEHLHEFNRDWRSQLAEDGSNAMQYRYQIRKPGTAEPFQWYTSSYRLLRGEDGILYQVCSFVDRG